MQEVIYLERYGKKTYIVLVVFTVHFYSIPMLGHSSEKWSVTMLGPSIQKWTVPIQTLNILCPFQL